MEDKFVTEEEFLQALEIVKRYDRQVSGQYERMREQLENRNSTAPMLIRKTPILEAELSIRALNAINSLFQSEGFDKVDSGKRMELTVEEFYHIFSSGIPLTRNFGNKSIKELDELFIKAGLKGHFEDSLK